MPKIVKSRILVVNGLDDPNSIVKDIEHVGRTAYMSWDKETPGSAEKFVQMIVKLGHESVLEHRSITVIVECDRATAQQLTRHRIASFTMQSQRYCNYASGKFGKEISFIDPEFTHNNKEQAYSLWLAAVEACEEAYMKLIETGCTPEDARSVLPMSTACVIAITANLREWRHIIHLRTDPHAQHNIRKLVGEILDMFTNKLPSVFSDICKK